MCVSTYIPTPGSTSKPYVIEDFCGCACIRVHICVKRISNVHVNIFTFSHFDCNTLATHLERLCNTPATHLQHTHITVTHRTTLQHTTMYYNRSSNTPQHATTHCNTQDNTPQHTCNALLHTCNTPQHTVSHLLHPVYCNTL